MDAISRTRRHWLLAAAGAGAAWTLAGCATPRPGAATSAPTAIDPALASRVDRVTWGASDSSVDQVQAQGFEAWLAGQLRPGAAALPGDVQARIAAMAIAREPLEALVLRLEDQRRAAAVLADDDQKKAALQDHQQALNRLAREAMSRQVLRALYSPHQVLEQMAWFWSSHFSVHQYKRDLRAMLGDWDETLRRHALGRFRDLLGAATRHPAMLRYLDNEQNAAGRLNENHARELLELHTLGVDGGYSQADVQSLARVLTGVGVHTPAPRPSRAGATVRDGLFEFDPRRHDGGPKQLLGQPLRAQGLAGLDEALDRLAAHPSTARHVCRRLAQFWMSDAPPGAVVAAMADAFRQSGGDIARVLRTLFAQPAYWQARKFKDPVRYVLSAVRAAHDERCILNTGPVLGWLGRIGQLPWSRPTPDGWPLASEAWSSAGQMATRFEVARTIGASGAGLFRPDEPGARDLPGFPRLDTPLHRAWRARSLSGTTRAALAQATSPQEWNGLLLSSPEFMQR